jgi:hypothetical protein
MRIAITSCVLVLVGGCARSHERIAALDADDAMDAFVDTTGEPGCELIAGRYRRCGPSCLLPCNAMTGPCNEFLDVCYPYYRVGTSQLGDSCDFVNERTGGLNCFTGLPCAVDLRGLPCRSTDAGPGGFCGSCVTPEFCIAARGVSGLPPFECVWSDGTAVVSGPPPGDCPTSPSPTYPFCGGSCGIVACPGGSLSTQPGGCVGVSETRSFGVCEADFLRCREDDPMWTRSVLENCRAENLRDCACLVPSPQPQAVGTRMGFVVLASVCDAYRAAFPTNADCVDRTWTSLP